MVSLVLIFLLLGWADFDLKNWARLVADVDPWLVLVAIVFRPLAVWGSALRISLVLRTGGSDVPFKSILRACMLGEMLSRFVPGNLGTMAHIAGMTKNRTDALLLQFVDKIFFLLTVLIVATVAIFFSGYLVAAFILAGVTFAIFLGVQLAIRRVSLIQRWVPENIRALLTQVRGPQGWRVRYLGASLLSLGVMTVMFWLLVLACGGSLDLASLVATVALTTIATAIPVTINGAGIREWVYFVFVSEGLPAPEMLITLVLLSYAIGMVFAVFGAGIWAISGGKKQDAKS